jgi:F0F1-type ATP synthase assembly protein I
MSNDAPETGPNAGQTSGHAPEPRIPQRSLQTEQGSAGQSGKPNPLSLLGLGMEVGAVLAVLTVGGWWLDRRYETTPWLTLIGAALGMIGGMYNFVRVAQRFVQK